MTKARRINKQKLEQITLDFIYSALMYLLLVLIFTHFFLSAITGKGLELELSSLF